MLWPEYWLYQEQHLREQILAAQTELKEPPSTAAPFQKLERSARHALRSYLRQCVRRATGRILLRHPDGLLRSFSVARRLRRFILDRCHVRMQICIGNSGNAEYPEQVRTLPMCFANDNETQVRGLDHARITLRALSSRRLCSHSRFCSHSRRHLGLSGSGESAGVRAGVLPAAQSKKRRQDLQCGQRLLRGLRGTKFLSATNDGRVSPPGRD